MDILKRFLRYENAVQAKEDYVLKLLEDAGLVTRSQIENAKSRLNGSGYAVDLLIKDGIVSDADVSRSLARQSRVGSRTGERVASKAK